ncbi:MAG: hypothetical protein PHQ13_12625, partial [Rhodoferax sp.]|nr:hypothetical protein [Rhodoferax sp.]
GIPAFSSRSTNLNVSNVMVDILQSVQQRLKAGNYFIHMGEFSFKKGSIPFHLPINWNLTPINPTT